MDGTSDDSDVAMSAEEESRAEEEALLAAAGGPAQERPRRHRFMTRDCPPLGRLMRGAKEGAFGPAELHHLRQRCAYCELTLRLSFSECCPSFQTLTQANDVGGALSAAVEQHLADAEEDGCVRCQRLTGLSSTRALTTYARRPPRSRETGRAAGGKGRRRPRPALLSGAAAAVALVLAVTLITFTGGAPAVEATPLAECTARIDERKANQLVVAAVWTKEERKHFQRVLERFHKSTGIRVTFATDDEFPNRQMGATLRALARDGCAPDVALLPQPGLLRNLVAEQRLQPVDSRVVELVQENYTPTWRELATVNQTLYGVWFKATNKSMFWYNAKAFARARVEPPRDWEQFKTVAAQLQASGVAPLSLGGADGWTLTDWFENVYLRTAGPEKYDQLSRHEGIKWTDPSVKHALATLAEVFGRTDWVLGGTDQALRTKYEGSVRRVYDKPDRPEAAMVFGADYIANEVAKTKAKVGLDAKFFDFPTIEGSSPTVVGGDEITRGESAGGDVAVTMTGREPGRKLLAFLATPEAAEPWVETGGFISPNKGVDPGAYPDEATREAAMALVESQTVRFDLSDLQPDAFGSTSGQGMWKIFQDFLRDPSQVERTAERLERCRNAPVSEATTCHG
ncbi:MAG TPA: extracellular solute-binding protein [Acidimicrobiales bacterium]|nr:extracellular solute-binding protein [Acidimicrobiales bacterium]